MYAGHVTQAQGNLSHGAFVIRVGVRCVVYRFLAHMSRDRDNHSAMDAFW